VNWSWVLAFGVLACAGAGFGVAAGFLKFQESSSHTDVIAASNRCRPPRTAPPHCCPISRTRSNNSWGAAKALLTGTFRDSYTSLTKDVVIPGAKQKQISAEASVSGGGVGVFRAASRGCAGICQPAGDRRHGCTYRYCVLCPGDGGQDRRPLVDLRLPTGVMMSRKLPDILAVTTAVTAAAVRLDDRDARRARGQPATQRRRGRQCLHRAAPSGLH